eukprot:TRINITY_DN3889_c0_g1_i1.p1 TRINITY_DN3889_c0_g1~~TRINITY_DN3889_c0_g1_i1.p1  ORF type:complete len:298 (+),score=74.97 TRINITY_DN3889_c0_g1_i1:120-896(+)
MEVIYPPPATILNFAYGTKMLKFATPHQEEFRHSDICFSLLPSSIGVEATVQVVSCLLAEEKVFFWSKHYSALTTAAEVATKLLYPFRWPHVHIPILPRWLMDFMQAPTPYVMGMHKQAMECRPRDMADDVVIVDLDRGTVDFGSVPVPELPAPPRARLIEELERVPVLKRSVMSQLDSIGNTTAYIEDIHTQMQIRGAFMRFFADLFRGYEKDLMFLRRYPKPIAIFNQASFMKAHDPDYIVHSVLTTCTCLILVLN